VFQFISNQQNNLAEEINAQARMLKKSVSWKWYTKCIPKLGLQL